MVQNATSLHAASHENTLHPVLARKQAYVRGNGPYLVDLHSRIARTLISAGNASKVGFLDFLDFFSIYMKIYFRIWTLDLLEPCLSEKGKTNWKLKKKRKKNWKRKTVLIENSWYALHHVGQQHESGCCLGYSTKKTIMTCIGNEKKRTTIQTVWEWIWSHKGIETSWSSFWHCQWLEICFFSWQINQKKKKKSFTSTQQLSKKSRPY